MTKAQVELDLTRTGIENGIPGLVKPAGKPAKLAFTLDQRGSDIVSMVVNRSDEAARTLIESGERVAGTFSATNDSATDTPARRHTSLSPPGRWSAA